MYLRFEDPWQIVVDGSEEEGGEEEEGERRFKQQQRTHLFFVFFFVISFVLFCFLLVCFVLFCFVLFWFGLVWFVSSACFCCQYVCLLRLIGLGCFVRLFCTFLLRPLQELTAAIVDSWRELHHGSQRANAAAVRLAVPRGY